MVMSDEVDVCGVGIGVCLTWPGRMKGRLGNAGAACGVDVAEVTGGRSPRALSAEIRSDVAGAAEDGCGVVVG